MEWGEGVDNWEIDGLVCQQHEVFSTVLFYFKVIQLCRYLEFTYQDDGFGIILSYKIEASSSLTLYLCLYVR